MQVAILGHWHTGTTLLAKTLARCGMEVGNENTGWGDDCVAQCEHGTLNRIGDEMVRGFDESSGKIAPILQSYVDEASRLGWECYGVKVTHALHDKAWPHFRQAFKEVWPECRYVVTVRALIGIIESTNGDTGWGKTEVLASYRSTLDAYRELIDSGAAVIVFPNSYTDCRVYRLVDEIGLKWKCPPFDFKRVRTFSEAEIANVYAPMMLERELV